MGYKIFFILSLAPYGTKPKPNHGSNFSKLERNEIEDVRNHVEYIPESYDKGMCMHKASFHLAWEWFDEHVIN